MANKLYPLYKQLLLGAGANLITGTVKAVLVNTTNTDTAGTFYTQSDAHQFLSDVPAGARIGTPQTLASKTVLLGVFDADNITFPLVGAGNNAEALVLYLDTAGADTTDPLIAYIDTATGLPVVPNGGDITITWSDLANKIFAL